MRQPVTPLAHPARRHISSQRATAGLANPWEVAAANRVCMVRQWRPLARQIRRGFGIMPPILFFVSCLLPRTRAAPIAMHAVAVAAAQRRHMMGPPTRTWPLFAVARLLYLRALVDRDQEWQKSTAHEAKCAREEFTGVEQDQSRQHGAQKHGPMAEQDTRSHLDDEIRQLCFVRIIEAEVPLP